MHSPLKGSEQARQVRERSDMKKKKSSKSVLPNLRTVSTDRGSSLKTKKTMRVRTRSTNKSLNSVVPGNMTQTQRTQAGETTNFNRNKTPASRKADHKPMGSFGFPALTSAGTQRSKELYSMNYILDIDNQTYSSRQNSHHLGGFYQKLVSNRVLQDNKPTPLLAVETNLVSKSLIRRSLIANQPTHGLQTVRHKANLSRTIQDDMTSPNRINENSALDAYATVRQNDEEMYTTFRPERGPEADKRTLLPSIAHLQSDDSLFGDSKTVLVPDDHAAIKHGVSNITDINQLNSTQMTAPQTSKNTQPDMKQLAFMQLTEAESLLQKSSLLDPLAGNSVISQLGTSLRVDAINQISGLIQKSARKRSQQRRRNEVNFEAKKDNLPGHFTNRGSLEEVLSESSAMKTETESVADSAIYKEMANDLSGFIEFIGKDKAKESVPVIKKPSKMDLSSISVAEVAVKSREEKDLANKRREDPEAHFKNLKAKIKLKVEKQYQEDLKKKEELATKQSEPVLIITDRFGRAMDTKPRMSTNKIPSKPRLPVKKDPPKRKLSFTESQMQYYGANDIFNPMHKIKKPSLTDKYIIDFMKQVDSFPIKEALVGRIEGFPFSLRIDSLIKAAYRMEAASEMAEDRPLTNAPYNSMESEDEFYVYESVESEDPNAVPYITKEKVAVDPTLREKQFDMRLIETSGFRLESVKFYPYRSREGDVPTKLLLNNKLQYILDVVPMIAEQQKEKLWDSGLIQNIFEHYCVECKAAPIKLASFYNYDNINNTKLSFKNHQLDEQTVKALALTLPYIHDIDELDMNNNQISDMASSTLVMAFFMNPNLRRITCAYNYIRTTFCRTLARLISMKPDKITDINLMGSVQFHDHIDPLIRVLPKMNNLTSLNIAGCSLTTGGCRTLSQFVFSCFTLRHLDVSHCQIRFQGTRYLIDALNRNTCIRNFNFSHNDLNSQSYEFSIKVASMLTRHPCLMHLDITNTNLKREEIMFIGLSVPQSKTLLSIHLTGAKLPYYERVFLRAVISARVAFPKKNATKKVIQTNKERNQVLSIATGEVQEPATLKYSDNLRDFDQKREDLDIEIQDLLAEIDTQATYENIDPEKDDLEKLPEGSKVGKLVEKLVARQQELEQQEEELRKIYEDEQDNVSSQVRALKGLEDMMQEDFFEYRNTLKQQGTRKPEQKEDTFAKMQELRVQRHKQRAEIEVIKENKDRSAGELALMFMGINQVAYDLLVENPMTGYMDEVIFSRVLGHDDIEEGVYWTDTTQCWICHKWNKVTLAYHLNHDREIFHQKVTQVESLQQTIEKYVQSGLDRERLMREVEKVQDPQQEDDESKPLQQRRETLTLKKQTFKEDLQSSQFGQTVNVPGTSQFGVTHGLSQKYGVSSKDVLENRSESRAVDFQEGGVADASGVSLVSIERASTEKISLDKPFMTFNDTTNPLAPIKPSEEHAKDVVYPADFSKVTQIYYEMPKSQEMYGKEEQKLDMLELALEEKQKAFYGHSTARNTLRVVPTTRGSELHSNSHEENALRLQRQYMGSKEASSEGPIMHSSVISHRESKRRVHGEPRIIQRQIFFEGVVYQIEEELYSDSDHSSIYTSEDEFDEDRGLQKRLKEKNQLLSSHSDTFNQHLMPSRPNTFNKSFVHTPAETPKAGDTNLSMTQTMTDTQKSAIKKMQTTKADAKDASFKSRKGSDATKAKDKKVTIKEASKKSGGAKKLPEGKKTKSSYSKEKQALMREYFSNDPNLTEEQQQYEVKHSAKHYRPELAEKRVQWFADHFKDPSKEKGKRESILSRREQTKTSGNFAEKLNEKELFCVASFNDWMPARMKTLRTLNMERFPMMTEENEMPRKVKLLDSQVALHAQMVPPGDHYFYFVKEKGTIFLSPNYEVIRFKKTDIYLNRVTVAKRLEDVETVHVAKLDDEEEPVFMKDRSVFKDFREDTQPFLKKCFDEDIAFGKIHKTIKKGQDFDAELQLIKDLLWEHYVRLSNIFLFYSGTSSYPTLSMNDFTSFCRHTGIYDDDVINLATLDLVLVATCVSTHNYLNSKDTSLHRYEFLEFIVRMAIERYKATKKVKTVCEGIEKVLNDLIYPNAKQMDGDRFRRYHCYAVKVNEILKKNESQIQKVYISFTHAQKRYIVMPECQTFVRKVGLNISLEMVGALYAESMMTIQDPIRDQTRPNQMKYVEFLVFLCRIAFEHYQKTPYANELLYLKLDHLMPAFLAYLNLQPFFLFGEKFQLEIEEEELKAKRRRQKLKRAQLRAQEGGKPVDARLVAEVKAYEEAAKKTGMASFKASQMGGGQVIESDSDLGESTDNDAQRQQEETSHDPPLSKGQHTDANDANEFIQNADLAHDIGAQEGFTGITLTPPDRTPQEPDCSNVVSPTQGQPETVMEEDDEEGASDADGDMGLVEPTLAAKDSTKSQDQTRQS